MYEQHRRAAGPAPDPTAARSGATGKRGPTAGSERMWDSLRCARDAARAAGSIPVSACEKLWDLLADREGELCYEAEGFVDPQGRAGLHLHVTAAVHVRCRRCLEPLTAQLDSRRDIVMVAGASEFEQDEGEDDTTDLIPLTAKLDLWALAEEEAVLSMPPAPCHAGGECVAAATAATGQPGGELSDQPSAFAALAGLKRRAGRG